MFRLPRPLATAPREASQFCEFAPADPQREVDESRQRQMQEDLFNDEQLDGDEAHIGEMMVPIVQYNFCLLISLCWIGVT
jgi:hypothetical protein